MNIAGSNSLRKLERERIIVRSTKPTLRGNQRKRERRSQDLRPPIGFGTAASHLIASG
jgi:hypothetical protein